MVPEFIVTAERLISDIADLEDLLIAFSAEEAIVESESARRIVRKVIHDKKRRLRALKQSSPPAFNAEPA